MFFADVVTAIVVTAVVVTSVVVDAAAGPSPLPEVIPSFPIKLRKLNIPPAVQAQGYRGPRSQVTCTY